MKKKGSVSEFGQERNERLVAAFKANLRYLGEIPIEEIFSRAAASLAPRFYVSERRASEVMSRIDRGDTLSTMTPLRRAMYNDIYRIVTEYRNAHPGCSTYEATFHAVNSEAPSFYVTGASARVILSRFRNHGGRA